MVDKSEISELAKLTKLLFTNEQLDTLTMEMNSVVAMADAIKDAIIDEDEVDFEEPGAIRPDIVNESPSTARLFANAPTHDDVYFVLPGRRI